MAAPPPSAPLSTIAGGLSLLYPVTRQVFQRKDSHGDIYILGYTTGSHTIEAQFSGSSWSVIAPVANGYFDGWLTGSKGQGTLSVRWQDQTVVTSSVFLVGVGEIFIIAGQSNAEGQGTNNQHYTSSFGLSASMFHNDYTWKDLADPTDDFTNQVDQISLDLTPAGSYWPILATHVMVSQSCPVAFVPCARGGSNATGIGSGIDWQPFGNEGWVARESLLGSAIFRTRAASSGRYRAVLWHQGESDAASGRSQATYLTAIQNIAVGFSSSFFDPNDSTHQKFMPCKLQTTGAPYGTGAPAINAAIGQAWTAGGSFVAGPDLGGGGLDCTNVAYNNGDGVHLNTDRAMQLAAYLWYQALKTAFGW